MTRRSFQRLLAGGLLSARAVKPFAQVVSPDSGKYQPTWDSLSKHQVPDWFQDAKLGIFIHWGLYSVPAWAPLSGDIQKLMTRKDPFAHNPYAEWYLNSLRIKGSPTYNHHVSTYGSEFDYYRFAETFNEKTREWRPETWARAFHDAGARYVVLTTKHHDGFRLWPSEIANPHAGGRVLSADRDLVGELTAAVRTAGLKMGLYYSGGLDWTFTSEPIVTLADLFARVPQSEEYARYADGHFFELIRRYQPAILWNDISYPKAGKVAEIFATFYNTVPDGVVDNRFGVEFADYTTPEYQTYEKITEKKWEACRGLGFSFGYNQQEGPSQVIAPDELVALLVDIVSKNGNLLLNVGPRADGTIPEIQMDRLQKLGAWMEVNGEGIHGTRPWVRPAASMDGSEVRFTRKDDSIYVFFLKRPNGDTLTVPKVYAREGTKISVLGSSEQAPFAQQGPDLRVTVGNLPRTLAVGLKITPVPWQMVRD